MTTTFDPDGLREKYRLERDKRLREDGNEQYIDISEYAQYLDDPYTRPATREPLVDEVTVAIIGGGFGGLLAGARLREAGIEDLRVIERLRDKTMPLERGQVHVRSDRHTVEFRRILQKLMEA